MRLALTPLLFFLCSCATVEREHADFYSIDSVTGYTIHQRCWVEVGKEWLCVGISEPDGTHLLEEGP